MVKRSGLLALVVLALFLPGAEAKVLSTHQARVALNRELIRDPDVAAHHLGRCHRVTRRLIDCNAWIGGPTDYPAGQGYDAAWTTYRVKRTRRITVRFLDFMYY